MAGSATATAYHVGRRGEVAGGMTQVVNSYLSWDFDAFTIRVIESRNGSRGLTALVVFLRAVRTVLSVRRDRPAVFVVHLSQGGSFVREGALLRLAALRGFGTVAQLHGSSFAVFSRRHPLLVRWVLSAATAVHALSDETAAAVGVSVPGVPCVIIANAVPGGLGGEKEKLVVFGGAVTRRKGVDVLLDAWRSLPESDEWALEVVGPVLEPEVVAGALPNATMRGSLPHDELMALLDRSSIAVLPSRDEAMPMFIIEAMARSNAVIATRVGGIPAVLDGGAGLLIDPDDATVLAAAISSLTGDPILRGSVARAGHARFEQQFSATVIRPRLESLWTLAMRRTPQTVTSSRTSRTTPTTREGSQSLP